MPIGSENNIPPLLTWEIENGYVEPIMSSSITLHQMRERLAEARKRLKAAEDEVDAWQRVVAVESANSGEEQPEQEAVPNKSEALRKYLRSQLKGVTYKMIRAHFEQVRIPVGSSLLYNLIDKWQEKGDIERRDGKIFWKGDSDASATKQ